MPGRRAREIDSEESSPQMGITMQQLDGLFRGSAGIQEGFVVLNGTGKRENSILNPIRGILPDPPEQNFSVIYTFNLP